MPIDMSGFGSEISGGEGNVQSDDEILRASVHSVFLLTESSFGVSNRNGNRSFPIEELTISSEALRSPYAFTVDFCIKFLSPPLEAPEVDDTH